MKVEDLAMGSFLPDVLDVFWLSRLASRGIAVKGLIPVDSLLRFSEFQNYTRTGGEVKLDWEWRSLRYARVEYQGKDLVLAIRDLKPIKRKESEPRLMSEEAIGVIIPMSVLIENTKKTLTKWHRDSFIYRHGIEEPNSTLGMAAYGVLDGKDTIWWRGDRSEPVTQFDYINDHTSWRHTGWTLGISALGLSIPTRAMEPYLFRQTVSFSKIIIKISQAATAGAFLIVTLLFISLLLLRRRHARNQIALAHLAHAVKTPVARLKLAAETLTEGRVVSPEEEGVMLKAVTRECNRLDRAVQNAALSLEKGRLEFNLQAGDLAQLVRDVGESWKPSFDKLKIELKLETPESLTIAFDKALFPVMLDNLIDNGLRHTRLRNPPPPPPAIAEGERTGAETHPPAPSVTISLTLDDKYAILTVDDSGEGIAKSERSRLFKRFSGSSRDPKSGATGLGLGLALVKEIVEGHKGSVELTDAPRGGARFEVRLPV